MDILFYLSLFYFGCILGSFVGVVVQRSVDNKSFISGRSHCDNCHHSLGFFDLIPLLSYLIFKFRCRYCKYKIPVSVLFYELVSGIFFVALYLGFISLTLSSDNQFLYLIFISLLTISITSIFFYDLFYMLIPVSYFLFLALLLIFFSLFSIGINGLNFASLLGNVYALIFSLIFYAVLHFGTRKKMMGEGDIYLAGALAFFTGIEKSILMNYLAFIIGAVYGVIIIVLKNKNIKTAIPFGPFIIIGFLIAINFYDLITNVYFMLISY